MLIDGFLSALKANNAVTSVVTGGIYENELPRGYTLPAVAIHQYGGSRGSQLDGPEDVGISQIQVDAYGMTGAQARAAAASIRAALEGYTGTLPDGTVVQLVTVERSMAMPFLPRADQKGIANRWLIGFQVTSVFPQV